MELEALFAAAQDEIDIRNNAIIELSNAIDVLFTIFMSNFLIKGS